VIAVNSGSTRPVRRGLATWNCHFGKNHGFACPVNFIIGKELEKADTHVLVMNNDLVFEQKDWLCRLLEEKNSKVVCSPVTDRTASKKATAAKAVDAPPIRVNNLSAFCWLVPRSVIKLLKRRFGFWLFDPDFFAYGEDDYTSAILRRYVDPKPFKVVRRSWVRHLKHQTGKAVGLSGGMPKNVALLKSKMKSRGLR